MGKHNERAGECFCCGALFQSVDEAAIKYSIDLDALLEDLNREAGESWSGLLVELETENEHRREMAASDVLDQGRRLSGEKRP